MRMTASRLQKTPRKRVSWFIETARIAAKSSTPRFEPYMQAVSYSGPSPTTPAYGPVVIAQKRAHLIATGGVDTCQHQGIV